jgi:hypothetical protein
MLFFVLLVMAAAQDERCTNIGGSCKEMSLCEGSTRVGLCGGGATRRCCLEQVFVSLLKFCFFVSQCCIFFFFV